MSEVIYFYDEKSNYYEFSNFFIPSNKIIIDGDSFLTTEHYFQAVKFEDLEYYQIVKESSTPEKAFYLGRMQKKTLYPWQKELNILIDRYKHVRLRNDWQHTKNNVMRKAVYQKFYQDLKLQELLLSTEDRQLVEHTKRDNWWADGGDGSGKNMLGKILMEVRTLLRVGKTKYPKAPTATSNWVIPYILIASNDPSQNKEDVYQYLDSGIDTFVNLMELEEIKETEDKYHHIQYEKLLDVYFEPTNQFAYKIKDNLMFIRYPIVDRRTLSDSEADDLSSMICFEIAKGNNVLIHCRRGKGRTGTICGIMLGKLYGMTYDDIIATLRWSFQSRIDKGEKHPLFHQTNQRYEQIKRVIKL